MVVGFSLIPKEHLEEYYRKVVLAIPPEYYVVKQALMKQLKEMYQKNDISLEGYYRRVCKTQEFRIIKKKREELSGTEDEYDDSTD